MSDWNINSLWRTPYPKENNIRNICKSVYYNQQINFAKLGEIYSVLKKTAISSNDLLAIADLLTVLKQQKDALENENPLKNLYKATSSSILNVRVNKVDSLIKNG